jgi:WD40 repeat protein
MFFYDVETGKEVRHFATDQGNQYPTYSPDHRFLITVGPIFSAQNAYLWDAQTGEKLRTFNGYTKDITSLAFTPDGRYVVAGGDDKTIVFWDVTNGKIVQTLTGHTLRTYALTFSADGRTLLTGSLDGTARLWDWQSGRELRRFVGQGAITSAIFSPDEQFALIGSSDGKVYITPTSIDGLVQTICKRVLRDLSPDERLQYVIRNQEPTCMSLAP